MLMICALCNKKSPPLCGRERLCGGGGMQTLRSASDLLKLVSGGGGMQTLRSASDPPKLVSGGGGMQTLRSASDLLKLVSGGGGIRTHVQTYSSKAFYMLSLSLFVGKLPGTNKPTVSVAAWS
jgi:hypothetical protein